MLLFFFAYKTFNIMRGKALYFIYLEGIKMTDIEKIMLTFGDAEFTEEEIEKIFGIKAK